MLVEVDDDFGVGVRVETMALAFESRAQRLEVVDLTIEDHPDGSVFVVHGLMPTLDVNDAEAPHSEHGFRTDVVSRIVRSAVHHRVAHRLNFDFRYRLSAQAQQSCDSTHSHTSVTS